MLEAFSVPGNRRLTGVFLGSCALLGVAAAVTGLDDNPPGILLAVLSACALVAAVVHPWKSSRQFRRLIYASALGFLGFAVLHNVLEVVASDVEGLAGDILGAAGAAMFLAATLVCPAGLLVGGVGAVVRLRQEHNSVGSASSA